jgi:hypothetical protein
MANKTLKQQLNEVLVQVGTDIKSVKKKVTNIPDNFNVIDLATKIDLKEVEKKIAKGGGVPTFDFSVEENGEVYVDITYPENTPTTPVSAELKIYNVNWGVAQAGAAGNGRGYLEYTPITGLGKLHLDIKMTQNSGNGGVIATLPANAPVPLRLLEVAVDSNNNSIYVEPNSRNIKGWGVQGNNRRYIFDIIGFWKET